MPEKTNRPVEGASRAENRPKRIPVGQRSIINYGQLPGYKLRLVNDVENRIQEFKDAYYEVVTNEDYGKMVGDPDCAEPTKMGSAITKHVGGGRKAVLMKIKEELFNEDQAAKAQAIQEVEDTMQEQAEKEGKLTSHGMEGIQITR